MYLKLNLLSSKDMGSILKVPKSSVHHAPMTSLPWKNSPIMDLLASSIVKDDVRVEGAMIKHTVYSDVVSLLFSSAWFVLDLTYLCICYYVAMIWLHVKATVI
jgi:hypothetical protein